MRRQEIRLDKYQWNVVIFFDYTSADSEYLCQRLTDIGCAGDALINAYEHFLKGGEECGLTYSNISERKSIVAIGKSHGKASMVNTLGHELLHVVAHVCEADGIDMMGEEACYLMGTLCEKIYC